MAARAKQSSRSSQRSAPQRPASRAPEVSAAEAARIAKALVEKTKTPERRGTAPKELVFARRPFWYDGVEFDREGVFELVGLINDEKLVRLGYVAKVPANTRLAECGKCGKKFLSQTARDAHGDRRHRPAPPAPEMEPQQPGESNAEFEMRKKAFALQVENEETVNFEREEREINQRAPLFLENTTASRS